MTDHQSVAEQVAQQFHETYERLAPEHGYRTREASAKPWADVPDTNKQLMIAVVYELLTRRVITATTEFVTSPTNTPSDSSSRRPLNRVGVPRSRAVIEQRGRWTWHIHIEDGIRRATYESAISALIRWGRKRAEKAARRMLANYLREYYGDRGRHIVEADQ